MSNIAGQSIDSQSIKSLQFCRFKVTEGQIHIGRLIKLRAEELSIGATELAGKINTGRQNVYDIFDRGSIDTLQLSKICEALDYDFFAVYQDNLKRFRSLQDSAAFAEEKAEVYFKTNKILLDRIAELEKAMNPQSRGTLVSRIVHLATNYLVQVVMKDDLAVKMGTIYYDKDTGDNVAVDHPNAIKGIYLMTPKSEMVNGDHIQLTMQKADREIYRMAGEYIELADIHSIEEFKSGTK